MFKRTALLLFLVLMPYLHGSLEEDWVLKYTEKYPELLLLANSEVRKTEEGCQIEKGSDSVALFGKQYVEFDRTVMTLRVLHWVIEGSDEAYELFTQDQPIQLKLSPESFSELHFQVTEMIESGWEGLSQEEMIQALEVALILGDMGKSEKARLLFDPHGGFPFDHDDFHELMLIVLQSYPELLPSFDKLPRAAKMLLSQSANLAHYGHITHLEGGNGMFTKLVDHLRREQTPFYFNFDLMVHLCDVAGALGHINPRSSLTYTESTHRSLQAVKVACQKEASEQELYDTYLELRAKQLGLKTDAPAGRVLTRIGAMLRLYCLADGKILEEAFASLNTKLKDEIIAQLDPKQGNLHERTPTYMPAMLINLANHEQLGNSREERVKQAVTRGVPFLAKALRAHTDPKHRLCFNHAAGVAKREPQAIHEATAFEIDLEGMVQISTP